MQSTLWRAPLVDCCITAVHRRLLPSLWLSLLQWPGRLVQPLRRRYNLESHLSQHHPVEAWPLVARQRQRQRPSQCPYPLLLQELTLPLAPRHLIPGASVKPS